MIEPEAVIDPEAVPPARPRPRRALVAGVTLLALLAGGFSVANGGDPEAKPLALMAGNGAAGAAETMSADAGAPAPVAPALGSTAARSSMPYGWGFEFEVVGRLPALPDHADAWDVNTADIDRSTLGRIAEALSVTGTPVQRDGGWFVEGGDWTLSAFGGESLGKGGAWSINLYRSRYDGRPDGGDGSDTPGGPEISRPEAEQRVRDLLGRMGAPRASWKVEVTDTEIGVGSACAVPGFSSDELRKLEAEKLSRIEQENVASSGATTAVDPAPPSDAPLCPPPPPPVQGFNVALYPLLDGRRADWPVWNVTMRTDGRLENLYGSWVNFERGGEYKLRGVDAALQDLRSPGVSYATDLPAAVEPAVDLPADGPVCPMPMPMPMPMPVEDATVEDAAVEDAKATSSVAAGCVPPAPQVVKITGVDLGLIQTSVFEDGQVRMALVPSYRFTGHFDNGERWETSVLALHASAIAPPPPDAPVGSDVGAGGGTTGSAGGQGAGGKSIPPTPAAEPRGAETD